MILYNGYEKIVNFILPIKMKKTNLHTLNSSSAKQKYSFGHQKRFSPYKATTDVAYLPSPLKNSKSAIMGCGERSILEDRQKAVYPHAYQLPSQFGKKGNSWMGGRHDNTGPFGHVSYLSKIPGPSYEIPSTMIKKEAPSIKSRLRDNTIKNRNYIPGPGTYQIPSVLNHGKNGTFQSQYSRSGAAKYKPKSHKSYEEIPVQKKNISKTLIPGPGTYSIEHYAIGSSISPLKNLPYIKIGQGKRSNIVNERAKNIPGPGEYKIYSQFDS